MVARIGDERCTILKLLLQRKSEVSKMAALTQLSPSSKTSINATPVRALVLFGESLQAATGVVHWEQQMTTCKPLEIPANEFTCTLCGSVFYAFPSAKRVVCSSVECKRILAVSNPRSHGGSRSRLHNIWCGMRSRCKGTSGHLGRKYYHSQEIRVCEEWNDFAVFQSWAMANGYEEGLEIDRRDSDGHYEPSNCRWATRSQQMRNTRKRANAKTSRYRGVSKHSQNKSWVAQGHRNGKPVNIGSFKTEVEAAKAYDAWAEEHYGEYASLNF